MKISELTHVDLMEYARETSDDPVVHKTFEDILTASKSFVKSYTGLTDAQMDAHEELTIALQIVANDMYDNRSLVTDKDKFNPAAKLILGMHSVNLL